MNRLNYSATNSKFEIYDVYIYCLTAITEFAYLNVFTMRKYYLHERTNRKNDFAERSKILARHRSENLFC